MRKSSSALRDSFYYTEEDLKRCERVVRTTRVLQPSKRVWVKYNDGIWAATVAEVDALGASFDVRFECDGSTETIVVKGCDRVAIYYEDLGQPSDIQRSSRFRGVSWKTRACRWQVSIGDGNKKRYLGTFRLHEEEAAGLAYDVAARALGRTELNFPERASELDPPGAPSDTSNSTIIQAFERVEWTDITPFRGYARDSEEVYGRAAELVQLNTHMKTRDDMIFALRTQEQLVSRQQVICMAHHPERIR